MLFQGTQHVEVAERAAFNAGVHLIHHAVVACSRTWLALLGRCRRGWGFLESARVAHGNALGIAVEFEHNEVCSFVHSDVGFVRFSEVLHMARTFQSVWQSDNGLVAVHFHHCSGMLRSHSEDGFEYFPWVLLELLVSEAHATVVLVQFKNHYLNLVSYAAEL